MWQYDYLDALELAANAGDAESSYQLALYHGEKWSSRLRGDQLEIWGVDHYQKERDYLAAAVSARHPGAQMQLGKYLLRGHPDFGYKLWAGIKLWGAGRLGEWQARRNPRPSLRDRLALLANPNRLGELNAISGRSKLTYYGAQGAQAACGVRFHQSKEHGIHVVLEQLPTLSLPSVVNEAERIATKALYLMLLSAIEADPENIHWYNAFPAGASIVPNRGTLQRVRFEWNDVVYTNPQWESVSPARIPIDLSDIMGAP